MLDGKTERYLNSKREGTRRVYRAAFKLFDVYTKEELGEEITGSELVRVVAQDRIQSLHHHRC